MHDTPAPAAPPSAVPRIALIAAVARNGVIGLHGRLPWRLPDDLKRFRTLTNGHAIVMGRKTWDSIGKPLPERQLPLADLLFLTEINREFDGDARFPDFDHAQWRATARESRRLDGDAGFAYDFASYSRLRP